MRQKHIASITTDQVHDNVRLSIKYIIQLIQIDTSTVKDTVIALIDAGGSCADVDKNTNCGSAATGYYETFEYNGQRVIIVSGAPNHAAETEMFLSDGEPNPNIRCKTHNLFSYIGHMLC